MILKINQTGSQDFNTSQLVSVAVAKEKRSHPTGKQSDWRTRGCVFDLISFKAKQDSDELFINPQKHSFKEGKVYLYTASPSWSRYHKVFDKNDLNVEKLWHKNRQLMWHFVVVLVIYVWRERYTSILVFSTPFSFLFFFQFHLHFRSMKTHLWMYINAFYLLTVYIKLIFSIALYLSQWDCPQNQNLCSPVKLCYSWKKHAQTHWVDG